MSRKNDIGHYELGNVEIKLFSENSREANTGQPRCGGIPKTKRHRWNLAILSPDRAAEIKSRFTMKNSTQRCGKTIRSVALQYGVSPKTVSRIWNGTYLDGLCG